MNHDVWLAAAIMVRFVARFSKTGNCMMSFQIDLKQV